MSLKKTFVIALSSLIITSPAAFADEVVIPQAAEGEGQTAEAPQPEQEAITYTVVPRDTLWDISEKFLKNPFKWPGIWKLNPYIKNPHLIYPGNVVKITPDGIEILSGDDAMAEKLGRVELEPDEAVVTLEPEAVPEAAPVTAPAAQKVRDHSIARGGFVTDTELSLSGAIIGPKEKKVLVTEGDDIFISFKEREGLKEGDRFTIFTVGEVITHPVTKKKLGNEIDILGSLTITKTNGVPEGVIDTSYKEIPLEARLTPYRAPVSEVELTSAEADVAGYIVMALEGKENLTKGDIAYIDRGASDGIKKGNLMRIYREVSAVRDPLDKKNEIKLPPVELGTLVVLDAGEKTSSGIVIDSTRAINWGDQVSTIQAN